MKIVEPLREGKIQDMVPTYFHMKIIDIGQLMHNTMVNIWRTTNTKINDTLEEFKLVKETLKTSNKELTNYFRAMLEPLAIVPVELAPKSTFDPTTKENKNLLVKLK